MFKYMSRDMRFPTMWYVRPAKPQISLRIRAVWSEPLLVAWIFYECWATEWTSFGVSKFKRRLQRLVLVYSCHNTKLLEITCHGSYYNRTQSYCKVYKFVWIRRMAENGFAPPPREFCRHILSCRELKAESFKRCLHSVLRGVSL